MKNEGGVVAAKVAEIEAKLAMQRKTTDGIIAAPNDPYAMQLLAELKANADAMAVKPFSTPAAPKSNAQGRT